MTQTISHPNQIDLLNFNSRFFQTKEKHYFHLVANSQLPIITSSGSMLLVLNIVFYLHVAGIVTFYYFDNMAFQLAGVIFSIVLFAGFLTVVLEASQGYHTLVVRKGLRFGMILFIVSEIMFFFAFFWAFFHVSLSPSIAIGGIGPPKSIQSLDIGGLPLVNTILLLSSGVTITLAHRAMLKNTNFNITEKFDKHMFVTIILGVTFLYCQGIEYKYGITFRGKENIYGSTFFATTGFHGLHVTIGTIFLLFCLLRNQITSLVASVVTSVTNNWMQDVYLACYHKFETYRKGLENMYQRINETFKDLLKGEPRLSEFRMTKNQHLGFEAAAWYGHFVDIVGIFLFITIYGGGN